MLTIREFIKYNFISNFLCVIAIVISYELEFDLLADIITIATVSFSHWFFITRNINRNIDIELKFDSDNSDIIENFYEVNNLEIKINGNVYPLKKSIKG